MKKIGLVLIVMVLSLSLVGCQKKNQNKLIVDLNDNIKATAKITKLSDSKMLVINFNRMQEGKKVKVKLNYYKNKKIIYEENLIYNFPNKDTECIMEIPIRKEKIILTNKNETVIDNKEYTKDNTKREKLAYDYLKLNVSSIK